MHNFSAVLIARPWLFFCGYSVAMMVAAALVNRAAPQPSATPNALTALWALGMMLVGALLGVILPTAFLNEALNGHYNHLGWYYLASTLGGLCGFTIGYRGHVIIAKLSLVVFVGMFVVGGAGALIKAI